MAAPLLIGGLSAIVVFQLLFAWRARRIRSALRNECAALRAMEKWFRALRDSAPFEIVLKDAEGSYLQVNKAWEKMYGFTNYEVIGKQVHDVFSEEHAIAYARHDDKVFRLGVTVETEEQSPHPDGTIHDFLAIRFPIPGDDGTLQGIGLIAADITERKRAEQALRDSEAQLRTITNNLPVYIGYVDRDRRIRFANKTAEAWFHRPADAILGKPVSDFFSSTDFALLEPNIEKAVRGESARFEASLHFPDGNLRTVEISYVPDIQPYGAVRGWFSLVQDVTSKKKLEAELLRKERLAAMGQLTGTVAHELRNPLGAITMSLGAIRHRADETGLDIERALSRAARAMTRCETIITEMLDFARAKGLQLESTPLDQWLAEVLDEYEAGPDVAMSRELRCGGLALEIDRDALRRAIFNILDNACQAMAQDREDMANDEISVTTRAVPGKAELIFRDNGPGISADILPDVMEPLFSTKSFGTGLGLPTVKRIMDDHRGAIEIANQPHGGACITLSLPTFGRHK